MLSVNDGSHYLQRHVVDLSPPPPQHHFVQTTPYVTRNVWLLSLEVELRRLLFACGSKA